MRRPLTTLAIVSFFAASASNIGSAQDPFDAKKFFDEIASRGVDVKGFDGAKFFEELASRGYTSRTPIDGKQFFEELSRRGVKTSGFDGQKFFEDLSARGVKLPDMVKN